MDANLLLPVLTLPDGWRAWRLADDALLPGRLRVRSVIGPSFPRPQIDLRGGLLTRPDGLVAAGFCSTPPHRGARRLQGALPDAPQEARRRAWIWLSWDDAPLVEAFADLLDRARAGLHADDRPAFWTHHARLAHETRVAALRQAVAEAEPLWNAP